MKLDCGHEEDAGFPATVDGKTVQGWTFALAFDGKRKLCHACASKQVLDCGHEIGEHSSIAGGYGRDADGKRICYACCAERDRADMAATGRAVLYLSHNKGETRGSVGNWPGSLSIPCRVRQGRHNIARTRYDVWFTFGGENWHGTQYGENTQLCHCRRMAKQ